MLGILMLGSKEYPFGTNLGDDPVPSGGMETYVNDIATELSRLCRLTIVTRKFRGTSRHEKSGNIDVVRVPWVKGRWLRNPSFNLASFFSSFRAMRDIDIVYSNGIVSGLLGLALAKLFRKKSVYRPAGISFMQYGPPLRHLLFALESIVFRKSDAIVFHSDGEKLNAHKAFDFRESRGHVILTGFPVLRFSAGRDGLRKEMGMGDEFVIASVSRLVPVKGLSYLLEACSMLSRNFRLMLVGSGPEDARLKEMAAGLGIADKVLFTGFRLDIPYILASADVFVVSSVNEGLPTSLLEAMAARRACIVTDIGLPVENLKTGIVVAPKSPEALRGALEVLMKNTALRKELGENAARFVEENCTQEIAARKHLRMFESLTGGLA